MIKILKNYDLTRLNTFGIKAQAKFFVEVESEADIPALFNSSDFKNNQRFFLGGGSNTLFTKDFDGLVILNNLKGMEILEENNNDVLVRAMGGENWHDLVLFTVEHGLWGIENLSLVPGSVGAAPMQNIGAYGAELKNTLESIEAYDVQTGEKRIFKKEECNFGYRDSIFKNEVKGQYFISAINLKLSKVPKPNVSYKILQKYLEENKITDLSLKNISEAVSEIRRSKLPDPKVIGNAGSFFKNLFVSKEKIEKLLEQYPDMPTFAEENERGDGVIKISSAWLIEQCNWKGKRVGNAGVHERQALVLVNHGGATGQEILNLAQNIIDSVEQKFGLRLAPEVNII